MSVGTKNIAKPQKNQENAPKPIYIRYKMCYNRFDNRRCRMLFSEKVKRVRQALGLSQEDLARKLDMSFATINRWESGIYKPSKLAKKVFDDFCEKNNISFDGE